MVWYKPTWFKRENTGIVLHCDNPECGRVITSDAAYEPQLGTIYHPGKCKSGIPHSEFRDGCVLTANFETVSYRKALELYNKNMLRQARTLHPSSD